MLLSLLLVGCGPLWDRLAAYTDADVAGGLVLGVAAPEGVDLSLSEYGEGAVASAFLATLEGELVDEAALQLRSPSNGLIALTIESEGVWTATAKDGLVYTVGERLTLVRNGVDILSVDAAPLAEVTLPEAYVAGVPLEVDASGQDYDGLLVSVVDVVTGATVWTNTPDETTEMTSLLLEEAVLAVTIPGQVFKPESVYAVGVAGLRGNAPDDVAEVNVLASSMMSGILEFWPVSTVTIPVP